MNSCLKKFLFLFIFLQQGTAHAFIVDSNKGSLIFELNRVKASMSLIKMSHVHGDFIHQEIYLNELLGEMNKDLVQNINVTEVADIARELNATTDNHSVGYNLLQLPLSQQSYYRPPIDASSDTLGRKAVGTSIFEQYTLDLLSKLNKELNLLELGDLNQFVSLNKVAYSDLSNLTRQFYHQANKVKRIEMNFAFNYEKRLLAGYSNPLNKFYR